VDRWGGADRKRGGSGADRQREVGGTDRQREWCRQVGVAAAPTGTWGGTGRLRQVSVASRQRGWLLQAGRSSGFSRRAALAVVSLGAGLVVTGEGGKGKKFGLTQSAEGGKVIFFVQYSLYFQRFLGLSFSPTKLELLVGNKVFP
jgi:hypothetical protein